MRHYQQRGIFRQWELIRLRSICKVLLDGKDLRGYIAPLLRMPTRGLCVLRPTWAHPGSKADIPAEVGIRGIFYSARTPESVPLFPTSLKSLLEKLFSRAREHLLPLPRPDIIIIISLPFSNYLLLVLSENQGNAEEQGLKGQLSPRCHSKTSTPFNLD